MQLFNMLLNQIGGDYELPELTKCDLIALLDHFEDDHTNRNKSFIINRLYKTAEALDQIPNGRTIQIGSGWGEVRIQKLNGQFKVLDCE